MLVTIVGLFLMRLTMINTKSIFLFLLIFAPFSLFASDVNNRFMAKGAGLSNCDQFLSAAESKGKKYHMYGGWVDGYITSYNQLRDETFDVAPWQSTDYLIGIIAEFCKDNRNASFYQATAFMVNALDKNKLTKHSPLLTIKSEGEKLLVHEAVLKQVQDVLSQTGYYKSDELGGFNKKTEDAIRQFQKDNALKPTGLPDQLTLIKLLYGKN